MRATLTAILAVALLNGSALFAARHPGRESFPNTGSQEHVTTADRNLDHTSRMNNSDGRTQLGPNGDAIGIVTATAPVLERAALPDAPLPHRLPSGAFSMAGMSVLPPAPVLQNAGHNVLRAGSPVQDIITSLITQNTLLTFTRGWCRDKSYLDQNPREATTCTAGVKYANVLVTVRNMKGEPVADWHWQGHVVWEEGVQQNSSGFTSDPVPLSVALVIDTALPADVMRKVNRSLSPFLGGLPPPNREAIVAYGNGAPELVSGFTSVSGARMAAALITEPGSGVRMGIPDSDSPLSVGPIINGAPVDPVPPSQDATGLITVPKTIHRLNDAILLAARQLADRSVGERRILFVISDGRNSGSRASYRGVLAYLRANDISVYGVEVGDASLWGVGRLERLRVPLLGPQNLLPRYAKDTGGTVTRGFSKNGLANVAAQAHMGYTVGYAGN